MTSHSYSKGEETLLLDLIQPLFGLNGQIVEWNWNWNQYSEPFSLAEQISL